MSQDSKKQNPQNDEIENKAPRIRGIGNPKSHSQDADRHRKIEHPKSDK